MSYVQRLIRDDTCGLNYDYMGYAEYEFGATRKSRTILGRAYKTGRLGIKDITLRDIRTEETVRVYVYSDNDILPTNLLRYECNIENDKGALRFNAKIIGWMTVLTDSPVLILRDSVSDRAAILKKFFDPVPLE